MLNEMDFDLLKYFQRVIELMAKKQKLSKELCKSLEDSLSVPELCQVSGSWFDQLSFFDLTSDLI